MMYSETGRIIKIIILSAADKTLREKLYDEKIVSLYLLGTLKISVHLNLKN